MAISFAKNCKDRCPIFSPCFGVIPGHAWGKNGKCLIIIPTYWNFSGAKAGHWKTSCVSVAYLLKVHPVKYLPMISSLGNMSQMPQTDFFKICFYIFYCINGVVSCPGSLGFLKHMTVKMIEFCYHLVRSTKNNNSRQNFALTH